MIEDLPSHFIDLVEDALLQSFWRNNALLNFLRRHKISENFLATWHETETKRVFVARLLPKLEAREEGSQILKQMAVSLADQITFPIWRAGKTRSRRCRLLRRRFNRFASISNCTIKRPMKSRHEMRREKSRGSGLRKQSLSAVR